MMKKGTRHDEVIGTLFDRILKDIDALPEGMVL